MKNHDRDNFIFGWDINESRESDSNELRGLGAEKCKPLNGVKRPYGLTFARKCAI